MEEASGEMNRLAWPLTTHHMLQHTEVHKQIQTAGKNNITSIR